MQSIIVKAPGRINLIGEHTDYNNGFVLPAAIQKAAIVSISKRADDQIHLTAIDIPDELIIESVANLCVQEKHWANYVIGVIVQFIKRQKFPTGFNLAITSDVPIGAGLSSSAAIECAIAFGLNELFQFDIDKMELTFMTQKAEHEFAGVECGIMDQFASLYGKKDQVVFLDCESMEYTYFPLDLKEYQIVLFDTGVKHALATSEYNTRRKECALGIGLIQEKYPKADSLRNATLEMLNECIDKSVDPIIFKRAKYVIEEIERTKSATQDLISNDLKSFGQKMFETHDGLSKLYEVSCPELDFLVTFLQNNDAVLGARMMGGGFGGCTLNIIKSDEAKNIINEITQAYLLKTSKQLQHYIVSIEDGASVVSH